MMRSLPTCLAGAALAAFLIAVAPGCGGGTSGLEKVPEIKQNPTMADMPGFNEMQEKMKTEKKK